MSSSPNSSGQSKNIEKGFVGGVEEKKPFPVNENVLQKHAAFFDLNKDGVIYPWETYKAMREIGSSMLLSTAAAVFINVSLSQSTRPVSKSFHHSPTWFYIAVVNAVEVIAITATYIAMIFNKITMRPYTHHTTITVRCCGNYCIRNIVTKIFSSECKGKFPSPLFPIEVKNIQLGKHGSDSGVYDSEGRFVASKFEEIFTKHAHTHPNALTYDELKELIKSNREPKDFKGRIGGSVEWNVLYKLAKDKNGLLQKETIRGVYDGSLFEVLKKEHTKKINSS